MTQGIEASLETGPDGATTRPSVSSWVARNWMWLGVGGVLLVAGGFLLHQLMAWPPHEDETLALFVGRDSLPGVVEHVTRERGGAPLHFLLAWTVAHLGFGLGGLRILSAAFALGSLPLVAALGRRLGGPLVGLVGAAIVAPSWLFLFHGVYGRMYSLFLFLSLACTLALLRALESGGRGRWAVWVAASLAMVAAHPYGILLLAGQAAYVLLVARDRIREAWSPARPSSCSASRSGSPTSSSRDGSASASGEAARSWEARRPSLRTCGAPSATRRPAGGR